MNWLRKLYRRWLVRRLHDDCVIYEAMLRDGLLVPHGACIACEGRLRKLNAMDLPRAALQARGGES